jgi:KTSC domain
MPAPYARGSFPLPEPENPGVFRSAIHQFIADLQCYKPGLLKQFNNFMFYLSGPGGAKSKLSAMRRIPLESSTLASALHLPESRELELEFHSGEIYRYLSVPPQAYYELLAVPSKGGYYNSHIRNRFDFQKLARSQPAQNTAG